MELDCSNGSDSGSMTEGISENGDNTSCDEDVTCTYCRNLLFLEGGQYCKVSRNFLIFTGFRSRRCILNGWKVMEHVQSV